MPVWAGVDGAIVLGCGVVWFCAVIVLPVVDGVMAACDSAAWPSVVWPLVAAVVVVCCVVAAGVVVCLLVAAVDVLVLVVLAVSVDGTVE
jgi:hypothetical protein